MKYGVGIDVSKGKSTIAILSVEGEIIAEPFEINHDINGLNLLEEKIKDISKEDLKIVMEETGEEPAVYLDYKELLKRDDIAGGRRFNRSWIFAAGK